MSNIIKVLAISVLVFSISLAQSSDQKVSLAVLDFIGRNIPVSDAVTLSDRFRFELSNTKKFAVMERNQMNLILQEQNFQRSECDQSCAVEAGQLAAVQKIVTGAVTKFGKLYTVNIRLIDVATGKIEKETNNDCECKKEKLLTVIMKDAALKMAGSSTNSLNENYIQVTISTNLPGASLIIDGKKMVKNTPAIIDSVLPGKHTVVAFLGNLHAKKEFFADRYNKKELRLDLQETAPLLNVVTNPANAEIYVCSEISNRHISKIITPSVLQFNKQELTLNVFKAGYNDTSITLKMNQNSPEVLFVDLKPLDGGHSKKQMQVLMHRKKSNAGLSITFPSLAICGSAAYFYYKSVTYYDKAENYKRILNSSDIKNGTAFNDMSIKNKNAASSGDKNWTAAVVLSGVGLIGLTAGLMLYF